MIQEPIQPTPENVAAKPRRNTPLRIAVVVGLALLLAVPVLMAIVANAPPATPTNVLTAGASAAPESSVEPKTDKLSKGDKDHGNQGFGRNTPGKGPITITSVSGNDVKLGTQDGWTRTITVTGATKLTRAGQPITVGDLSAGDVVVFRQTRNDDGSYTVVAIDVRLPRAGGEVSAVTADTITVKHKDGSTQVITVDGSTVYTLGSAAGTKSDVTVGSTIDAAGTVSGDTFTAVTVHVRLAKAGGEVTKVDGDSITVKKRDGASRVITITGSTTFRLGSTSATKADVIVGSDIDASGTVSGDTFTATAIRIEPALSGGEVTAKTGDSIAIKGKDGKITTIHVSSSTTYRIKGDQTPSLADVAVGGRIIAEGTRRADGSLDATTVVGRAAKPAKAPKAP